MSRIVIETAVIVPSMGTLKKGDVLEVTAAQLTKITTAGGTSRTVSAASLRDALGESFGYCPNSTI
jgi:hypothetical protein